MRHRRRTRKLGMKTAHREAMLRNMVTSLFEHGRITTTVQRAKELRRIADRLVTLAKRGDLHARRQAFAVIRKKDVVAKLFDEIGHRFVDRQGGYTRIVRVGYRRGDAATMALVELAYDILRLKRRPSVKRLDAEKVEDVIPTAISEADDKPKVEGKVDESAARSEEASTVEAVQGPSSKTGPSEGETLSDATYDAGREDQGASHDTESQGSPGNSQERSEAGSKVEAQGEKKVFSTNRVDLFFDK